MKSRLLSGLIVILALSVTVGGEASGQSGYWLLSGSNLYPSSTSYNVGIGTTAPASKFHVMRSDSLPSAGVRFTDAAIFENNGNSFLQILGSATGEKSINFAKPTNGADAAIKFNQAAYADSFSFWAQGNQPRDVFWYNGALDTYNWVGVGNLRAGGGVVALLEVQNWSAGYNRLVDVINGSNADVFTVMNDGKIGIGAYTPSNILTVQQNSTTDPIADAWTIYSSRRWKTNIETIPDALDLVGQLRGVSFDWRADGRHDIGLIAEEVGQVIPEVVSYEDNGVDAKSVDYARLVAILIQATNEQQVQIEAQQAQITDLETRLSALESAVGRGNPSALSLQAGLQSNWFLVLGLLLVGLVVGPRFRSQK